MDRLAALWASARDEVRFRLHDRRARRERAAATINEFPHKAKLDDAYARNAGLRSYMEAAKAAVDDARGDLKQARSRISSWHAKSKSYLPFYGKRGKPIPRHSWFVFSHSDLDAAKRDADRAGSRIAAAIRERNRIWSGLQRGGQEIDEIKESRSRRRAMLDAGRNKPKVHAEARAIVSEIVRLEGAERRIAGLRECLFADGPEALEIAALEERIRRRLARRAAAMAAFDGPAEEKEDRLPCRAWASRRGDAVSRRKRKILS